MRDKIKAVFENRPQLRAVFNVYEATLGWNWRTIRQNWRYRAGVAEDGLPIPPVRLIVKVAGTAEIGAFLRAGDWAADSIRGLLNKNGLALEQFEALLDFGCGCGRVIRRWHAMTNVQIHGVDYNPELVHWCGAHLPFARFAVNGLEPPLPYAAGSFDFIYALSVFTHLPETLQQAWLADLARVLKPGGHALLTLHGDYYLPHLTPDERQRYQSGEWVVKYAQVAGTNLCASFCSPAYVTRSMTRSLDLVDFVPQGAKGNPHQDACLLRKPADRAD